MPDGESRSSLSATPRGTALGSEWQRHQHLLHGASPVRPGSPEAHGLAGIGVVFERRKRLINDPLHGPSFDIVIDSLVPGGSADLSAQILPGDVLLRVDGDDVAGMAGEALARRVLGAPGTAAALDLARGPYRTPVRAVVTRAPAPARAQGAPAGGGAVLLPSGLHAVTAAASPLCAPAPCAPRAEAGGSAERALPPHARHVSAPAAMPLASGGGVGPGPLDTRAIGPPRGVPDCYDPAHVPFMQARALLEAGQLGRSRAQTLCAQNRPSAPRARTRAPHAPAPRGQAQGVASPRPLFAGGGGGTPRIDTPSHNFWAQVQASGGGPQKLSDGSAAGPLPFSFAPTAAPAPRVHRARPDNELSFV
jgi:hypothetical protein